jgi:hypothetical protein
MRTDLRAVVFCHLTENADKKSSCSTNRPPLSVELIGLSVGAIFNGSCRTGDSSAISERRGSQAVRSRARRLGNHSRLRS